MKPNECNNLDELFRVWRKCGLPPTKSWEAYNPCSKKSERFYPDGFVNQSEFGGKRILFILVEGHVTCRTEDHYTGTDEECDACQHDWFADCLMGRKEKTVAAMEYKDGKRYFDKTLMMKQVIDGVQCSENDYDSLREAAYMNINKSGGEGNSNNTRLKNYVDHCGAYIQREIELIAPDIIICCGSAMKDGLLENILRGYIQKRKDIKVRVVYMWHPAARKKPDVYEEHFRELWKVSDPS